MYAINRILLTKLTNSFCYDIFSPIKFQSKFVYLCCHMSNVDLCHKFFINHLIYLLKHNISLNILPLSSFTSLYTKICYFLVKFCQMYSKAHKVYILFLVCTSPYSQNTVGPGSRYICKIILKVF